MVKKKKKEIKKIDDNYLQKTIFVLIVIFLIIIGMSSYWIYAYNHKKNYLKDNIISTKVSDYVVVKGHYVYIENVSDEIKNDFLNKQSDIIDNNKVLDVNITKNISGDILSIKISYTLYADLANYEEVLTENINLREKRVLGNEEMLSLAGNSYKNISTSLFDEYIRIDSDSKKVVVDAITDTELSSTEFNQNSEKYILRIREELPKVIKIYMKDNKYYYMVRLSDIHKLCYYTNTDIAYGYVNKEILKINKEEL